jgi:hypothetical protein
LKKPQNSSEQNVGTASEETKPRNDRAILGRNILELSECAAAVLGCSARCVFHEPPGRTGRSAVVGCQLDGTPFARSEGRDLSEPREVKIM